MKLHDSPASSYVEVAHFKKLVWKSDELLVVSAGYCSKTLHSFFVVTSVVDAIIDRSMEVTVLRGRQAAQLSLRSSCNQFPPALENFAWRNTMLRSSPSGAPWFRSTNLSAGDFGVWPQNRTDDEHFVDCFAIADISARYLRLS